MKPSSDRHPLLPKLAKILVALNPGFPEDKITNKTLLIGDLNLDSLKVAELSVLLEEAFQVPIFVPELLTQVSDPYHLDVAALAGLVEQKLLATGTGSTL